MIASETAASPSEADRTRSRPRPGSRGAAVRLLILAVLLLVLGGWMLAGGGRFLTEVSHQVASFGIWAPLVFALFYALAETALFPGSVLTASAGVLFGIPLGAATVLVGATAGAALSFGLGRWLGRPAVARFAGTGRLARLDAFLARRGFWSVLVLRLVPLFPFALVNYGAGVAGSASGATWRLPRWGSCRAPSPMPASADPCTTRARRCCGVRWRACSP